MFISVFYYIPTQILITVLDDNGMIEYIKSNVAKPQASNSQSLAQWKKDVAKVRRFLLEGIRDDIISNIYRKETLFAMWKTLIEFFENNSDHRKMTLKDKVRSIKMQKNDKFV